MNLPDSLQQAIDELTQSSGVRRLASASEHMTSRYRSLHNSSEAMQSSDHYLAYLSARMPATFAAVSSVLKQLHSPTIHSLLDVGCGPGTAFWAAAQQFTAFDHCYLIEKDAQLINLGKQLIQKASHPLANRMEWLQQDYTLQSSFPSADMVILSYSIGEVKKDLQAAVIKNIWQATTQLLVIIEPGTPAGFATIRQLRQQLIEMGAHMVAPCPHINACPMSGDNWCHFSVRLERSSLHKRIKNAQLGYEDEKFSYIAVSKTPQPLPEARILRHPQIHSGHTCFDLCTQTGLERRTLSRKHGELYKAAKKLSWGDTL